MISGNEGDENANLESGYGGIGEKVLKEGLMKPDGSNGPSPELMSDCCIKTAFRT